MLRKKRPTVFRKKIRAKRRSETRVENLSRTCRGGRCKLFSLNGLRHPVCRTAPIVKTRLAARSDENRWPDTRAPRAGSQRRPPPLAGRYPPVELPIAQTGQAVSPNHVFEREVPPPNRPDNIARDRHTFPARDNRHLAAGRPRTTAEWRLAGSRHGAPLESRPPRRCGPSSPLGFGPKRPPNGPG